MTDEQNNESSELPEKIETTTGAEDVETTTGAEDVETTTGAENVETTTGAEDIETTTGAEEIETTVPESVEAEAVEVEVEEAAAPAAEAEAPKAEEKPAEKKDVIPGADLEPIAVESETRELSAEERARLEAEEEEKARREAELAAADVPDDEAASRAPAKMESGSRFLATGKRKRSIARVTLLPGDGKIEVYKRSLEAIFPRPLPLTLARQPRSLASPSVGRLIRSGGALKSPIAIRPFGPPGWGEGSLRPGDRM